MIDLIDGCTATRPSACLSCRCHLWRTGWRVCGAAGPDYAIATVLYVRSTCAAREKQPNHAHWLWLVPLPPDRSSSRVRSLCPPSKLSLDSPHITIFQFPMAPGLHCLDYRWADETHAGTNFASVCTHGPPATGLWYRDHADRCLFTSSPADMACSYRHGTLERPSDHLFLQHRTPYYCTSVTPRIVSA